MTESLNRKLEAYYDEIYSLAPCSKKQKKAFISELKTEIEEYVENFSSADINEIKAVFGSPEDIADGFAQSLTRGDIKKKLGLRKIIIMVLLCALIIWALFAVISLIDVHTEAHGYFSETVLYIYNVSGGKLL